MSDGERGEQPGVDVAAVMREVRRLVASRQERRIDEQLTTAVSQANEQWDKVYAPLDLGPGASLPGKVWQRVRAHLHQEVRGYLDPMIWRQTDFNASVVRALNSLVRSQRNTDVADELEALRDEVIQLRERVRRLEAQQQNGE